MGIRTAAPQNSVACGARAAPSQHAAIDLWAQVGGTSVSASRRGVRASSVDFLCGWVDGWGGTLRRDSSGIFVLKSSMREKETMSPR